MQSLFSTDLMTIFIVFYTKQSGWLAIHFYLCLPLRLKYSFYNQIVSEVRTAELSISVNWFPPLIFPNYHYYVLLNTHICLLIFSHICEFMHKQQTLCVIRSVYLFFWWLLLLYRNPPHLVLHMSLTFGSIIKWYHFNVFKLLGILYIDLQEYVSRYRGKIKTKLYTWNIS